MLTGMRRFLPLAVLSLVLALGVTTGARIQKGGDKAVLATVVDGAGRPFTDLKPEEWSVKEDGQARPVVVAQPTSQPLQIVLLVDSTKATQPSITDLRTGLRTFAHTIQAGADSAISLVSVAGAAVTVSDFGMSGADLDRVIDRLYPDQTSAAVLLESIEEAAKTLSRVKTPRRVILSINLEGFPEASSVRTQDVANAVFVSRAAFWAVSYRNEASTTIAAVPGSAAQHGSSSVTGTQASQNRDVILSNLTVQTGGARLTVAVASAIESSLRQIATALLSQYELSYTRPDGASPKQLQITVSRPGAHVLTQHLPPA
jgi:VWFA-related protein